MSDELLPNDPIKRIGTLRALWIDITRIKQLRPGITLEGYGPPGSTLNIMIKGVLAGTVNPDANGAWLYTSSSPLYGQQTIQVTSGAARSGTVSLDYPFT